MDFEKWRDQANEYAVQTYGLSARELADGNLAVWEGWQNGDDPVEFIEEKAVKYDLDRIE